MKVIESVTELKVWRESTGRSSVGFVPTMGALHQGHQTLLERSARENDVSVLSIFVNRVQFNDPNDFQKYPKTWEQDLARAREAGTQVIFAPRESDLYPRGYQYRISESEFSRLLCGAHRPGHFDGVLTVVMKLLNLVRPDRAYFGEKDFQQLSLIQGMVDDFFLPVKIVPVATVREQDGLAMSSRNLRLSEDERQQAPAFYRALAESASAEDAAAQLAAQGFKVDYVTDHHQRRYGAAFLGDVRLIDNVEIKK